MTGTLKKVCVMATTALVIGGPSLANGPNGDGTVSSADIMASGNPGIDGTATIYRDAAGIGVDAVVTGLRGGFPYTMWAVIFNNPQQCLAFPEPCGPADFGVDGTPSNPAVTQASLNYADDAGNAYFSGFVAVGGALSNGNKAEVHFVYRRHPDEDGAEYESLNMVGGNCPLNPDGSFDDGPADDQCQDEGFSIHQ